MAQQRSRIETWAGRLNRLSRPVRIGLIFLITLELVILFSVVIDRTLIDNVYEGTVDPMTPALIAAGIGFVLYAVGWWAVVGFAEPWHARRPAVFFVWSGC